MGVSGQRHAPAAIPPGKTRYPLYRKLGEPQGRSGQVRKISPPQPGFDHRTVQPVASRYTGPVDITVVLFMLKYHYILPRRFPCLELHLLIYAHTLSGERIYVNFHKRCVELMPDIFAKLSGYTMSVNFAEASLIHYLKQN